MIKKFFENRTQGFLCSKWHVHYTAYVIMLVCTFVSVTTCFLKRNFKSI